MNEIEATTNVVTSVVLSERMARLVRENVNAAHYPAIYASICEDMIECGFAVHTPESDVNPTPEQWLYETAYVMVEGGQSALTDAHGTVLAYTQTHVITALDELA